MPTLPGEAHLARHVAESFGADADRYDRTRPPYPDALVRRIAESGRAVLDVGAGTGILARQLAAAGCDVLGVEPDPRMAEFARRRGSAVEVATFETWQPGGRRFDAVVAGQAWHWVDPVAGARRAAAVLRPGGRLAVCWNVFEPPGSLSAAFAAVYERVLPDAPAHLRTTPGLAPYAIMLDKAEAGVRAAGAFGQPERWRYEWERVYSRDEWLDQVPTFGGHAAIPALDELLAGFGAAIDAAGGTVPMHYTTLVLTATRTL